MGNNCESEVKTMRTDINKIDDITPEMKLNDILYKEMQEAFA